ncbi:hypothetical protein [Allosphingosinicella sp.]|jgi:hypothetical protein|uniref:hypothetical protein n=1 Tax=Allosphingosinicella sp. TaxID=2823234 RepID=UPI002F19F578
MVDHDLVEHTRTPMSLFLTFVPISLSLLTMGTPHRLPALFGWATAVAATIAWASFVGWRIARLTKAAALKGDRTYDQRVKFLLPAEYGRSESATKARRSGGSRA